MRKEIGVLASKRPKTTSEFFDEWRALYDYMSYDQYVYLYSQIYNVMKLNNDMLASDRFALANFFHNLKDDLNVIEIGSWNGTLASFALNKFDHIIDWTGVEMCKEAAQNTDCKSDRFRCIEPKDFIWDIDFDYSRYNALVIARFIERMKSENLIRLLESISAHVDHVYFEARLSSKSYLINWSQSPVMGIFELGWDDIIDLMKSFGYTKTYHYKYFGFFERR